VNPAFFIVPNFVPTALPVQFTAGLAVLGFAATFI
jgi:hypothetical protein